MRKLTMTDSKGRAAPGEAVIGRLNRDILPAILAYARANNITRQDVKIIIEQLPAEAKKPDPETHCQICERAIPGTMASANISASTTLNA